MIKYFVIFFMLVATAKCQTNWGGRACLVDRDAYFTKVMQATITRIERDVHWSNLKLIDLNRDIDLQLFKWHARGTANYTNGFVVSMLKMDVNNIQTTFSTTVVNGTSQSIMSVRGSLHFRNLTIGYDVTANLEDSGTHRFTGVYMYSLMTMTCSFVKNLHTNEFSASAFMASATGGTRMEYLPNDSVSEVLSRDFAHNLIRDSYDNWNAEYIVPFMREEAAKIDLPEIRFDYSC